MSAGKEAFISVQVIRTVSVTLLTTFQFASTALTVMLKLVPAVRVVGEPVLPVPVPGAAASPGTKSCSLVKAPALTVILGLVFDAFDGCVTSEAVKVCAPVVFNVTLRVFVPATRAVFPGKVAIESVELSATWSVTLVITFQQSSTALTVTLKAVP